MSEKLKRKDKKIDRRLSPLNPQAKSHTDSPLSPLRIQLHMDDLIPTQTTKLKIVSSREEEEIPKTLLQRTGSMVILPVWSEQRQTRKRSNSSAQPTIEPRRSLVPILSRTEKLEKLAQTLTLEDIQVYTEIVESTRMTKNYCWKPNEMVGVWPDWHESLQESPNRGIGSPLPQFDSLNERSPSRGRSIQSPVLAPLPMRERSPSPGFFLDPERTGNDSDYSDTTKRYPIISKYGKLRTGSQRSNSPARTPDTEGTRINRSHSDGDLTDYLKGFSDLKESLKVAQMTCNNEIKKILEELQEHVQKSVDLRRDSTARRLGSSIEFENSTRRNSTNTSGLRKLGSTSMDFDSMQSLGESKDSLGSMENFNPKVPPSPGGHRLSIGSTMSSRNSSGPTSANLNGPVISITKSDASLNRLDTIYSASSSAAPKDQSVFNFDFDFNNNLRVPPSATGITGTRSKHRKTKSDSMKIALDLKLDYGGYNGEDKSETPYMKAISSVIQVAQSILDLDLNTLMAKGTPQKYITQIQKLSHLWSENPDWQLQELVVRLLIVFASVARLMEHFEEDFRSWNNLTESTTKATAEKGNRRFSVLSSKSSPKDSPSSAHFKRMSYSSAGAGGNESSDLELDEMYEDSDHVSSSPQRKSLPGASSFKFQKQINKKYHRSSPSIREENISMTGRPSLRQAVDEDSNLNVLIELDPNGMISYVSPTIKKIFLYSPEEVIGKPIPFLADPSKNFFYDGIKETSRNKPTLEVTTDAKRADGRLIKVECNGLINYDGPTNIIKSIVWILRPVKVSRNEDSPMLLSLGFPSMTSVSKDDIIPNVDMALCNICDRSVPAIHFSIHMEVCLKVHKTEMDLVLLNDELRNLKQNCDDRLELIKEELGVVALELKESTTDKELILNRKRYHLHLQKLYDLSSEVGGALDRILMIKIPKQEDLNYPEENVVFNWKCPSEQSFLPSFSQIPNQNSSVVFDEGLNSIGMGLFEIGTSIETLGEQKKNLVQRMRNELVSYVECLQEEQILILEIGIQTSSLKNEVADNSGIPPLDLNLNSSQDTKYELQDIGGVYVKIPSMMNLEERNSSSQKESLLFSNSTNTGGLKSAGSEISSISSASPTNIASPTKSLKRMAKNSFLRIKTDHDSDTEVKRHSVRNPRMVLGDKSLEIEVDSLLSPVLKPSAFVNSFSNLNSMISGSPTVGSPSVTGPSIKDYDIIKPISKGAFGSVYLAKKKITGMYFAIKVLRKADMVAKNQVTNIKSERTILTQLDSPYVVKLYSTFQSRNHIYLVMEYLNGGDCAALLKNMGQLDEPWARQYITEMIQGLEFLHLRDIVHRDLKPDNMLIDINGHIKLTDFGLSKAGFIGRRAIGIGDVGANKNLNTPTGDGTFPTISPFRNILGSSRRESIASISSNDSLSGLGSRITEKLEDKNQKKLVGTPDYLAPESILGLGQGTSVDWWAVGVILYEFLIGIPPFNAPTPNQVFENILMRRIDWLEDDIELSPEVRILMERLMCTDVEKRLGSKSVGEIKSMAWFSETDWDNLSDQKVFFVPTVKNIEDTDYFDSRGVKEPNKLSDSDEEKPGGFPKDVTGSLDDNADFGEAVYKNLPLLEKANQKTMSKIHQEFPEGEQWLQRRRDSLPIGLSPTPSFGSPHLTGLSPKLGYINPNRRESLPINPVIPTYNTLPKKRIPSNMHYSSSSENVSPKSPRAQSQAISIPDLKSPDSSRLGSLNFAIKKDDSDGSLGRSSLGRSSSPERDFGGKKKSQAYLESAKQSLFRESKESRSSREDLKSQWENISNNNSPDIDRISFETPNLDVLIADSNPVTAQILETILKNLNCRVVRVKTGGDVVQSAMGEIKFDLIVIDVQLPVVSGDAASRMIKSTTNVNGNTPIIGLSTLNDEPNAKEFNYVITKPVSASNVMQALKSLYLFS